MEEEELQELLGNTGFGELDRAEFEQKDDYETYFEYVKFVFNAFYTHLGVKLGESSAKKVERTVISYFLKRLLRSIELLNVKYQYDVSHSVRVDLTESSFPNHAELRQIKADYKLKNEFLEGLPNALILKDKLISRLRVRDEEPMDILDALAKRKYFTSLYPSSIYFMFNKGRLLEVEDRKSERKKYVYAWATYDMALNRPQIFVLDIEYSGEKPLTSDKNPTYAKLEEIIENISTGSQNIYEIITFVDQEMPDLHPKLIKKYDLGPLYGEYSKDESPFTLFHNRHNLSNEHFVLVYEEETVVSTSEAEVKSSWLSHSKPLQNFHVKADDPECVKRKLSGFNKTIIAPHKVIQLLLDDPEMNSVMQPLRNNMIAI